jgi:YVTN family beta-propeller protein
VYRVDLGSNTVTGSVGFGTNPRDPVLSADGSTLYVPDFAENRIHVVATQTMQVTRTIDVTGGPVAVALTADGSHLIVARWTLNDIALIDLATDEIVGSTDSQGVHPTALRIRPDNVVVVLNYGDYPTGSTTGSVATFRYTLP